MTEDQIRRLTKLARQEQGEGEAGIKAEISIMVNLALKHGRDIYEFAHDSGWFSLAAYWMDVYDREPTAQQVQWAREALISPTLPPFIDEHDCIRDIKRVTNYGIEFDKYNRSAYIPDVTVIENRYGSRYRFYRFSHEDGGDPFGYTCMTRPDDDEHIYLRI